MGEEVKIVDYNNAGGDEDRVSEWEAGLPSFDDLTPLSQPLIPPELASAFRILPEPSRSLLDVNRASQNTLSSLRGGALGNSHHSQALSSSNNLKSFNLNDEATTITATRSRDQMGMDIDETDLIREGSDSRKTRRITEGGATEEADSSAAARNTNNNSNNNETGADDGSARTLKRPRLVWTPQLHKRFVDVVAHLGIKNAVPKTIMQLMNVEGLTRENVASHLQKYRLYLKRMQGLSTEGPSPSDHLFASTPVPQSLHESAGGGSGGGGSAHGHGQGHSHGHAHANGNGNGHMGMPIPMPYPPPNGAQMVSVPMIGMAGHMGIPGPTPGGYHGYESHHHHHHHHHQYGMVQQQRDWSGNKFGPVTPYSHHVTPNDK